MDSDPYFAVPEKPATPQVEEKTANGSSNVSSATILSSPEPAPASSGPTKAFSVEEANEEIAQLLQGGKVSMKEVSALQGMLREHVALRDKVGKLKSLLGRSAKAQREAKMDLDQTQKRLTQSEREVERLKGKVEKLTSRPTHMDLLADFETNFDRALLSVPAHHQTGGQDTAANTAESSSSMSTKPEPVVDTMLLQELSESQARVEHLESLYAGLQKRASQMEQEQRSILAERTAAQQEIARLQLELRMAKMEADHATRSMQDKTASLLEMQMEIDLVTKASVDANVRAKQGEEAARSVQTDREKVQQLQMQVTALQEWALASAEAKRLSADRVRLLEQKLKLYQDNGDNEDLAGDGAERLLTKKSNSIVIGAGDVGFDVIELGSEEVQSLRSRERVILRWKFDVASELPVDMNLLKGKCDTPAKQGRADYLIKDRSVTAGAAGELEGAFAVQNACTVLWSNKNSWVRPRTIKYELQVLAVLD